jgi:ribosomal protein S4
LLLQMLGTAGQHVSTASASRRRARRHFAGPPPPLRKKVDIRRTGGRGHVAVRPERENTTIQHAMEEVKGRGVPEWLDFDAARTAGTIKSLPTREQINLPVQEQLIVELYSK